MLFPIFLFLMTLSPLYIPVAVTVFDQFDKWRSRRNARRIDSVRQFRPAVGVVPAAA
jgi:hypothetical protein